jgi:demethylmenaquinone methyltransferase/2-methoxy-6-polyprenyl-1,4-benzoquinol methylase
MSTAAVPADLLDKKEVRIQRMFGQIAPWYDFLNHLLSLNIDKLWRRWTTKLVPPTPGKPVLDLCTGTGDLAFAFDRAAGGKCDITGSDFCPEMLDLAREKGRSNGTAGRIQFVEADAQQLPFPSDHYDLVSVAFGLRNVTDTDRGLAEMVRVLAPGGRLAVLEFSRPRGRILGGLYSWYFTKILPRIGQMLSRSKESAYQYLPESVMKFPDGEELANKLRMHGLTDVTFTPFTFGIATLYVGTKLVA